MTSPPSPKRARTNPSSSPSNNTPNPPYELLYWPTIPGRAEPIRLCFEATSTPYTDPTNTSPSGMQTLRPLITPSSPNSTSNNNNNKSNPPHFAPPILGHGDLIISQLPNILLYLGPKLGLSPPLDDKEDPNGGYYVNQLALTALDGFLNEAHDTHHPISISSVYEEQREAAKARSHDYITNRLPKFLAYFENALHSPSSKGGRYLYGGRLTYADLVLFQCLDGVKYAFPKAVGRLQEGGEYKGVWGLYERVGKVEGVRRYLSSGRRLEYGNGIWRYYEELDE